MTPEQFKTWRKGLFKSRDAAAEALGISASTVRLYEDGVRRDNGQPVEIPPHIKMACYSISSADWCRREIEGQQRQLDLMEGGIMRTSTNGQDTTAESIKACRTKIEELRSLLAGLGL